MKATIWGSCGSLPSPASSATIREKLRRALWAARTQSFSSESQVDAYLDTLPHNLTGTYRANTSCVQIDAGTKDVILCDAGTGLREYALTIPQDAPPQTYHIFISHLHWDHIQGFPFFTPAYVKGNRIVFHGFHENIEETIRSQMDAPCFPVPFSTMQADFEFDIQKEGHVFQIEDISIKTIKQEHPGVSWGYRFEKGHQSIVYSTDSEHGPEAHMDRYPFVDFFMEADILIFDSQYTFEDAKNAKRYWGHSDHSTAVELAAKAKVKQLILCHHEPSYSDEEIERMRLSAEKDRILFMQNNHGSRHYPIEIRSAYDGLVLII